MSDTTNDDFHLRPGGRARRDRPAREIARPKSLTRQIAKAGGIAKRTSGRSTWAKPATPRTGRFNARGRGRAALARGIGIPQGWVTRGGMRFRGRRAIVKVSVVKLRGRKTSGGGLVRGQLAYLQREEAGVAVVTDLDGTERTVPCHGQLYGPEDGVEIDGRDFVERSTSSFDGRGDPHQFRIILSPEDGAKLAQHNADHVDPDDGTGAPNLRRTTRALMEQMERDLGTRLDWVAVDHFDTAHPHTHALVRGATHDGKGLNIAGEYIGRGIRGRLEEQLTRELGLKSELEVRREQERELDAQRVTRVDKAIQQRIHPHTNLIDLRAGSQASRFGINSDLNRHVLMGRMKHLETMRLVRPHDDSKGVWFVHPEAFDRLEKMHARQQLTNELHDAMRRAGIDRPIRLGDERSAEDQHGQDKRPPKRIIGRVIGKRLAGDEGMDANRRNGGKVRFIIDGTDGYVRAIETGLDTRAGEAAKIGSIVEVGPPRLRHIDRSIRDLAAGPDISGKPNPGVLTEIDIDFGYEDGWREENRQKRLKRLRVYHKRLATLAKARVITVASKGGDDNRPVAWTVPDDFERRAVELDLEQGRASGVKVLSVQSLEQQLASPGATWLDRRQVSWLRNEVVGVKPSYPDRNSAGFARDVNAAFHKRQGWLIERGHAHYITKDDGARAIRFNRGYTTTLEQAGHAAAADTLASQTGKQHVALQQGRMVEGTVTRKLELSHGPHAIIETQRAFYLVPWQSVHEQQWGRRIHGRVRGGGGIDWEVGRSRGIGR